MKNVIVASLHIAELCAEISIHRPLPQIQCDPMCNAAVLENQIANSINYNEQAKKTVETGYLDGTPPTFFIRDNGSGAGLNIARKHVEREVGLLWPESIPGQGSTLFFTLAAKQESEAKQTSCLQ